MGGEGQGGERRDGREGRGGRERGGTGRGGKAWVRRGETLHPLSLRTWLPPSHFCFPECVLRSHPPHLVTALLSPLHQTVVQQGHEVWPVAKTNSTELVSASNVCTYICVTEYNPSTVSYRLMTCDKYCTPIYIDSLCECVNKWRCTLTCPQDITDDDPSLGRNVTFKDNCHLPKPQASVVQDMSSYGQS